MGSMNFHLPRVLPIGAKQALERLQFVGGYDRSPFPTLTDWTQSEFRVTKAQNESCSVSVPWPIDGFGFPVTLTATLRERREPYNLLVELARGKLNQLRNAIGELELQGLEPVDGVKTNRRSATQALAKATLEPDTNQATAYATESMIHSYSASDALMNQFTSAAMAVRTQAGNRIPTRWSCRLSAVPTPEESKLFKECFSQVVLVPNWAVLEVASTKYDWTKLDDLVDWAFEQGYLPAIGPLIDLGEPLPEWLESWGGELPSLSAFFSDFVESVVHRYGDRIKNWILCSGFNHINRYGVSEDDRLRLVGRLLELAQTLDPEAKWSIGLAQPWGDYLGGEDHLYSPLVFADMLLRSGLPIGGFELELFAGDDDRSSLLRDGLDTVRLLDLFGLLGIPIDVVARHPGRDPKAPFTPASDPAQISKCWHALDTIESQDVWGKWISALSLSYSHIRSFSWASWRDLSPIETFGLISSNGTAKPLLSTLKSRRDLCV